MSNPHREAKQPHAILSEEDIRTAIAQYLTSLYGRDFDPSMVKLGTRTIEKPEGMGVTSEELRVFAVVELPKV